MGEHYKKSETLSYVGAQCYREVIATGGATAGSATLSHVTRQILVGSSSTSGAIATIRCSFAGHALSSAVSVRVPIGVPLDWSIQAIWSATAATARQILCTW